MVFGLIKKSKVDKMVSDQINKKLDALKEAPKELGRIRRTRNEMTNDWLSEIAKKAMIKSLSGGKLPYWLENEFRDREPVKETPEEFSLENLDVDKILKMVDSPIVKGAAKLLGFDVDQIKADPQAFLAKFKKGNNTLRSNAPKEVGMDKSFI